MSCASLLTAVDCRSQVHLVLGTNPLAATRCSQSLGAGALPIVIAPDTVDIHYTLQKRIDAGEVKWLRKAFEDNDLFSLGREEVDCVVDAVFITSGPRDPKNAKISSLCRRNRIPVNVIDAPHLCSFTILSTHTDGPLQIGVTTNGKGCKLASRIRREIASLLPPNLGTACARLGDVRRRIHMEDHLAHSQQAGEANLGEGDLDDSVDQSSSFNKLVLEADLEAAKTRRMRWLSQVCEYWPLKRLAEISEDDVEAVLKSYPAHYHKQNDTRYATASASPSLPAKSPPSSSPEPKKQGRIILAGSGPGHPDLLTRATFKAIQTADLILADKLVPSGVLDLVPRRTPVQIARKFPGNADAAQTEFLLQALEGVKAGKTVLRLKQGDPFLYGRGGEEVLFFKERGMGSQVTVLPGVTSALSAPLFAGVPVTQRDVADQVLVCTGTGKRGKPPPPPEFVGTRTVVFLMALHRIGSLVEELTELTGQDREKEETDGVKCRRSLWPKNTPCAVVERASCPDQRVIRTTLEFVEEAVETEGSRPPGLLVVGKACEALVSLEKGRMWSTEDGFVGCEIGDELVL